MAQLTRTVHYWDDAHDTNDCCFEEVRECPICHRAIKPQIFNLWLLDDDEKLGVVYFCPGCNNIFLATYLNPRKDNFGDVDLIYDKDPYLAPRALEEMDFSKDISKISPTFCEIYKQAAEAENCGLNQVCGSGYRKALEFLVKDFLCRKLPPDSKEVAKIRREDLSAAINELDSARIKTLAQRAAWLGNDETHYVRKHEELDVSSMKKFIRAILTFIDAECAAEEADAILPKK